MSRQWDDPYAAVLRAFNRSGVHYVVVGMSGINYYARHAAEAFATLDFDLFVQPTLHNAQKAFICLRRLGFSLGTNQGAFDQRQLHSLICEQRTLVATTSEGLMVELLLAVSGYSFRELEKDAATVTVHGIPVKVGRLTKLLRSKQLANRPKDRDFLRRYRRLLEE